MTSENFIYWLDGYLVDKDKLTEEDFLKIKNKLSSVFVKKTPYLSGPGSIPANFSDSIYNPTPIDPIPKTYC